ncbi:MAG: OpgC domain-containing protein [Planctomycetota bacterium]
MNHTFKESSNEQATVSRHAQSTSRLSSVDFLRGLALTIVILDHVDFWTDGGGFIRSWTLMGLGFSDAAEAFVFLSGLTLGWAYGSKISEGSFLLIQKRVLLRALQIYSGYLATVTIVVLMGNWTSLHSFPRYAPDHSTIFAALSLTYQPFGFGILCFYIVVLPFMPILLFLFHRQLWLAVGLSIAFYAAVQISPSFNLPDHNGGVWSFNPFAWQFLIVLGAVVGYRSRVEGKSIPKLKILTLFSLVFVVYVMLINKGDLFMNDGQLHLLQLRADLFSPHSPLISKTDLGPLRLLHSFAVFYLVYQILHVKQTCWLRTFSKPFIVSGRNSLAVYCVGIVLAYCAAVVFAWTGITWVTVVVVPVDACLLQFAIAYWLDHERMRCNSRNVS